jgi:hypothetical protein
MTPSKETPKMFFPHFLLFLFVAPFAVMAMEKEEQKDISTGSYPMPVNPKLVIF